MWGERERAGESASMRSSRIFPIERPQQQLFGYIAEIKGNFILNFFIIMHVKEDDLHGLIGRFILSRDILLESRMVR